MSGFSGALSSPYDATSEIYTKSNSDAFAERSASSASLAKQITKEGSKQTYYTIRLLADRTLAEDAFRAYAYFRWVDDILDQEDQPQQHRLAFLNRQHQIINRCYKGEPPIALSPEEEMVVDLIRSDTDRSSGLHTYINKMMAVMAFDVKRRGRPISQRELDEYTLALATAVTEALHYFIGHYSYAPHTEARYFAVSAAHVTHMLRDAIEDVEAGYYNIPYEFLEQHGQVAGDFDTDDYQFWVKSRVDLARELFAKGRTHIAQIENFRCRLAGYAYISRFEIVLDLIEQDDYHLRSTYPERKSKRAQTKMVVGALWEVLFSGSRVVK